MKKIIFCASLFLAFTAFNLTVSAQSHSNPTGTTTLPGSNIQTPQLLTPVEIPAEIKSASAGIQVSPNPSTGQFTVRFNSPNGGKTGVTVKHEDGSGMLSFEVIAKVGANSVPVNITQYGSGNYSVTVSGGGAYGTGTVVVQK